MNELMIKGTQNIQEKEIKVIEGGFGISDLIDLKSILLKDLLLMIC